MPPLPPVALDVIMLRSGRPCSLPAPTPTPTPVPTPAPLLMFWFSCTASGAPCSSGGWSFNAASRPTPAALLRAASRSSPGGLPGIGWRASTTGRSRGTGLVGSGAGSRLSVASGLGGSTFSTALGGGGGGGGAGLSSSNWATTGGSGADGSRSGSRSVMKRSAMPNTITKPISARNSLRKRSSSSWARAQGSVEVLKEMADMRVIPSG